MGSHLRHFRFGCGSPISQEVAEESTCGFQDVRSLFRLGFGGLPQHSDKRDVCQKFSKIFAVTVCYSYARENSDFSVKDNLRQS